MIRITSFATIKYTQQSFHHTMSCDQQKEHPQQAPQQATTKRKTQNHQAKSFVTVRYQSVTVYEIIKGPKSAMQGKMGIVSF